MKAEIETREKTFSEVVALGEAMLSENHPAKAEVREKIDSVLTERQKLHKSILRRYSKYFHFSHIRGPRFMLLLWSADGSRSQEKPLKQTP